MQSLARNGYTAEQVTGALLANVRELRFRYELLDDSNTFKANLAGVRAAWVANNALATDIKRTAKFEITDAIDVIDYLSDRIKPVVRLKMPDGGFAEFPQGVFLLTSPSREVAEADVVIRNVEAYDQLIVLRDDKVTDRYTVAAAANYISGTNAVKALLEGAGITAHNLTPTSKALPVALDWPPGTPKLRIVNDLILAINYRSLFFDETGRAVATPYVNPQDRAAEFTYRDDVESVVFPKMEHTRDLFDIPNRWVLVVSEPDRPSLSATYTNANPASPTSTVSRGRTIVDFIQESEAADQATLTDKVERMAFEASQVYESVEFETGIMPMHSDADVLVLNRTALGISDKYSEHTWEFPLRAGGRMKHRVRKVVTV